MNGWHDDELDDLLPPSAEASAFSGTGPTFGNSAGYQTNPILDEPFHALSLRMFIGVWLVVCIGCFALGVCEMIEANYLQGGVWWAIAALLFTVVRTRRFKGLIGRIQRSLADL